MRGLTRVLGLLTMTLVLMLALGTTSDAAAGIVWCVKDPIFIVDGRVVRVEDLVPIENADMPVHFVLRVAPGADASWRLPDGETLRGSVTIVTDDRVSRDTPRLSVRGEGPRFPMRLLVSGTGLRTLPYEVNGDSRELTVPLLLSKTGR